MRIIAGTAKGRTLVAPKGQLTRPTQDYVRESLFNIIQRDVPDAVVLDLFAGTGALGLEALSRGAARVVLADNARQAMDCIRRNADALGFSEQTILILGDYKGVLTRLPKYNLRFDLVFIDPPYKLTQYREMTDTLAERNLLADGALIVIEHAKEHTPALSPAFYCKDERAYGDTIIHLYRYQMGGMSDGT